MYADKKLNLIKVAMMLLALLFLLYLIRHCQTKPEPSLPSPVVIVKKPDLVKMAQYITQTGNTVAYNSVNLVARIKGYLDAIQFTDGTVVKKGSPLFIIEPEPYLEQLKGAQATVAVHKAAYTYAKTEYARQKEMFKENATSQNNVEKWFAKSEEAKAEIDKAVANAEIAAINYSYTHIAAPFDGRIGRHLVDAGNLVGDGAATVLATIEQIDPLYVYFNLNEIDLIKIREAALKKGFKPSDINQIPVYVSLQNDQGFLYEGRLDFVNTGLNASTGTMEFRALLPNKNYALVPGLFVQVRIAITTPALQLTVPDTALQYDQIGPYLLVVDKNNIVVIKRVKIGSLENGKRAILMGLARQDDVVIAGLQNATAGNRVTPKAQ